MLAWTPLLPPRPPPTAHTQDPRPQSHRKVATAAALASAVEWYDYFVFGIAAALVLGDLYFPAGSSSAGVLAAFATFAVGFLARPLGGIIAGHLGDKRGRKPMLVLALTLMGLATTAIGLLPTYETIGIAAPILLVLLRVAQGVAVGAQWGGAMLLATEYAPEGKRGVYGSLVQLGVPIGVVTANTMFLVAGRDHRRLRVRRLGLARALPGRPARPRPRLVHPPARGGDPGVPGGGAGAGGEGEGRAELPAAARSCAVTSARSSWPAAPSP